MEEVSSEQLARDKKEAEAREAARAKEKAEKERKAEEERMAEVRRVEEERNRKLAEFKRQKTMEEELKKLGSGDMKDLPPAPPSCVDDNVSGAMKAWILDSATSVPELTTDSLKPGFTPGESSSVTLAQLRSIGLVYFKVKLSEFDLVNQIVKERFYKHTDEIHVSQTCKDEQFLEKAYREHYNDDEQIRLIVDGSMYTDIRSKDDKNWIRLHLKSGDLIVIPAGMFHRSTLDLDDYCELFRIYRDSPRWIPVFRSDKRSETTEVRTKYLHMLKTGDAGTEMGFK